MTFMQKLAKENPEFYSDLVVKDWLPWLLKPFIAEPNINSDFAKVILNRDRERGSIASEFTAQSQEVRNALELLHTKYRSLPDDVNKILSWWEISDRLQWLFIYSDKWLEETMKVLEQYMSADGMKVGKDLLRWNNTISQVLSWWIPENIVVDNVQLTRQGKNIDIEVAAMLKKFNEQIDKGC
jgi:hypothetical protein